MDRIIGIDLGTTNSVVAVCDKERSTVLLNAEGMTNTPSVVLYAGNSISDTLVGELAKRQLVLRPDRVVRSIKRFIGRHYSELTPEMLNNTFHCSIMEGTGDTILVDLGDGLYVTPEEVSAEILKKMKLTAESYLGSQVQRAVITVPAYFNDTQRQATKHAAELADLQVARIINEPTAAALAYGLNSTEGPQKVVVFDLGGGTLDVSLLEISGDIIEVLATCGDVNLGGDNFDYDFCNLVIAKFNAEHSVDLATDKQAMQRLYEALEKCKCELSTADHTVISLPFITAANSGPIHLNYSLTREDFEALIKPYEERMIACCQRVLEDSGISVGEINAILPVGGSSRIPAVRRLLTDYFGRDPHTGIDPENSVALGAAIQGSVMTGALREVLLLDVTPLSLGIGVSGGGVSVLIARNSSIPVTCKRKFTTVRDNQRQVRINIVQGERRIAKENHTLGVLVLEGIMPAPKELPEIEVTFQIDSNGIMNVSACDTSTGLAKSITIVSFGVASKEDADALAAEAEKNAAEDLAYLQFSHVRTRGNDIAEQLRSALNYADLPDEMRQKAVEQLFRYDIACNDKNVPDMEELILTLQVLISRIENHILTEKNTNKQ